jgi:hypothetical protein
MMDTFRLHAALSVFCRLRHIIVLIVADNNFNENYIANI